jgi:hypothetical protein
MKSIWQLFKNIIRALKKLKELPSALDWFLSVIEPLIVVALTVVIVFAAYWLIFDAQAENTKRIADVVKLLNDNWKTGLLLIVLLFYRTVRTFLEQAEELFSVKRRKSLVGETEELKANPSHGKPQEPMENP